MRIPRQTEAIGRERLAWAPYNFVPLPDKIVEAEELPDHSVYEAGRHTGRIHVTLTTRSHLYVRCGLSARGPEGGESDFEKAQHNEAGLPFTQRARNKPDFFNVEGPNSPVIPGSSLRGMLRSVFEIITCSKMNRVSDRRLIYRAVGDPSSLGDSYRGLMLGPNRAADPDMLFDYSSPAVKGGYLEIQGDEWRIRPAVEHLNESMIRVPYDLATAAGIGHGSHDTHDVYLRPAPRSRSYRGYRGSGTLTLTLAETDTLESAGTIEGETAKAKGMVSARLVASGHMGGGHAKHWHCAVYEKDTSATPLEIRKELVDLYEEDCRLSRGTGNLGIRRLRDGDALFYLVDSAGKLMYFGCTPMFRLPYTRSIHDLLPKENWQADKIDMTEAVFGFVRSDEDLADAKKRGFDAGRQGSRKRAFASRIRVTDARPCAGQTDLLEPGPICPPILAGPKPTAFQHYLVQGTADKDNLNHYDSPPSDTAIRGHKRYWHQGRTTRERLTGPGNPPPMSTQHTQFRPVKPDRKFEFAVYFENLTPAELGALCWSIQPLRPDGIRLCHSLGMGKPLGMGAVELEAELYVDPDRKQGRYSSLLGSGSGFSGGAAGLPMTGETLEDKVKPFETRVLAETGYSGTCEHLWELNRTATLLKMMEWMPAYSNGAGPNTGYMSIQPNQYRNRPVLPSPAYFGGLTGLIDGPASSPPPLPPAQEVKSTDKEWVTIAGSADKKGRRPVRTSDGVEVPCSGIPAYGVKERCRADVIREGGKPLSAQFKGWS